MCQDIKTKKGYTLMEVVMATVIFSILVMGIGLPITEGFDVSAHNENINLANNLARVYLNDIDTNWSIQQNFDIGEIPEITSEYTNDGDFQAETFSEDLISDDEGQVIVKRVTIKYKNNSGKLISEIFMDFNRPIF
ncbi:MAG: prepilin-type N-terminal cleavage/methylation domain-containing protein [Candidatus Gastranaerophilales bacterium]|nr:prepilin-type N-terminal cleavage/methylation domain-containing protein [Candidatus Gastranaerophilales bacterium]